MSQHNINQTPQTTHDGNEENFSFSMSKEQIDEQLDKTPAISQHNSEKFDGQYKSVKLNISPIEDIIYKSQGE